MRAVIIALFGAGRWRRLAGSGSAPLIGTFASSYATAYLGVHPVFGACEAAALNYHSLR